MENHDDIHEGTTFLGGEETVQDDLDSPSSGNASASRHSPVSDWDRFEIGELLGAGGMGQVFEAWDPKLERSVAIKFLRRECDDLARRLLREAKAQARIKHPGICRVYEVGEVEGHPFICMQRIDGPTLSHLADELSLEEKTLIVAQVAEAVHAAHREGLIHRDLKPSNIMVERDQDGALRPFVVDFGLARLSTGEALTVTGQVVGTPSYMAPEQASSGQVDRRSDVYSLGATLYALLAGTPPFAGNSTMEILLKVVQEDAPPLRQHLPTIPVDLDSVVMACLEKEPAARYDSARALAEDLRRYLDGEAVTIRRIGLLGRAWRKARRHALLSSVGAAALLALAILGGGWLAERLASERRAEAALRFGQQAERLESALWRERSLPLHDMRPVREQVKRELEAMRLTIETAGREAVGPGNLSIGRGLLALGDADGAKRALERASVGGYSTPELAYALGLALGELYQIELEGIQRIREPERRQAALDEARERLRAPAIEALQEAAGADLASPTYLAARLAFYEDDYEAALGLARQALDELPWLYEAHMLEANAHWARASQAAHDGLYDDASKLFDAALDAYHQAAGIAPSDLRVLLETCATHQRAFHDLVWLRGRYDQSILDKALTDCRQSLVADPDQPGTHVSIAALLSTAAEDSLSRGSDPSAHLDAAHAAIEAALAINPDLVSALRVLNGLEWQRAKYEADSGKDPSASLMRAVAAGSRGLEVDPRSADLHNSIGLALLDFGLWQTMNGVDPSESLRKSADHFEQEFLGNPTNATAIANAALTEEAFIQYLSQIGGEGIEQSVERGLGRVERALSINPSLGIAHRTRGDLLVLLAEWRLNNGGQTEELLAKALPALETALEIRPSDAGAAYYRCRALLVRAQVLTREDLSTEEVETELRRAIDVFFKLNPTHPGVPWLEGMLEDLSTAESATDS